MPLSLTKMSFQNCRNNPVWVFEFLKIPFGLKGEPNSFQRFMDEVIRCIKNAYANVDDIMITSKAEGDHYRRIESVFKRLHAYGLVINMNN